MPPKQRISGNSVCRGLEVGLEEYKEEAKRAGWGLSGLYKTTSPKGNTY